MEGPAAKFIPCNRPFFTRKTSRKPSDSGWFGTPEGIRTPDLPLRSTGSSGCGSIPGENGCRIVSIGSVWNFDTISNCADDGGVYQCVATVCWQVCRQMQLPRDACGKAPRIEPPDIWLVQELAHIHWY